MERAFDADFTQGSRPLPRPRRHRRAAQAVVREPHARRGAQGARRARRVLGSVPDVHAAARRRLARRTDEPGVRRRRPPRHRHAAHPGVADEVPDRARRCRPRPRRSSACTPTRCSPTCSELSPTEIGTLHDDGVVASAVPLVVSEREPTLADAGFVELAHDPVRLEQAGRLAACLDVDPAVLDHGLLPALWHWALFHPAVPTAGLGVDGHPRRRRRDGRVPAAHVGRRPRAASRGRCASASTPSASHASCRPT